MMPRSPGIYLIRNTATGDDYIGSSIDVYKRWNSHRSTLRRATHGNIRLQRAWVKYGEASFECVLLEGVEDTTTLLDREQYWLDNSRPTYNLSSSAYSMVPLGSKRGPEVRAKIGAANRGRKLSEEAKEHMRQSALLRAKNHPPSEETRRKLGACNRGRKATEDARRNMSAAQKGRIITPEARQKISAALKGTTIPEETKEKIRETLKGRTFTDEWRSKISASLKGVRKGIPLTPEHRARISSRLRRHHDTTN